MTRLVNWCPYLPCIDNSNGDLSISIVVCFTLNSFLSSTICCMRLSPLRFDYMLYEAVCLL